VKHTVVRIITFVAGLYFLLEFLLPGGAAQRPGAASTQPATAATQPAPAPARPAGTETKAENDGNILTPYFSDVSRFVIIVAAMAFLLGPINLVRSHVKTLVRGQKGRAGSVAFLLFTAIGMLTRSLRETPAGGAVGADILHDALFHGITMAFFASSMALLSFYLVSAAHRAFRLNNLDAGVMMIAAVVVLLGQVPLGDWITGGLPGPLRLRSWAQWILMYPNAGVQRAVLIGAGAGAIAASMRHWLGLGKRME
jgi:hypothetical protein